MECAGRAEPAEFAHADAHLASTLENLEGAANYADWIYSLVRPHLGPAVLEVGAGHGTFTELLAASSQRLVAGDLSPRCVDNLRERFRGDPRVVIYKGAIAEASTEGPFDAAVLINVLEHIEDDGAALGELYDLLAPGGRLILWVPALPALYSDFDHRIGHYRRYRRSTLRSRLQAAGFYVTDCRYVNVVGAAAWLVLARWLGRTPTDAGPVSIYDKYFVPVLRRVEAKVPMPVGQSVLAIAVKPSCQTRDAKERTA